METLNTKKSEFKIITDSKDEPDLKAAQEFVGGYVEGITFPNGDYLIINEEGKLMNLPLNPEATALWRSTCFTSIGVSRGSVLGAIAMTCCQYL